MRATTSIPWSPQWPSRSARSSGTPEGGAVRAGQVEDDVGSGAGLEVLGNRAAAIKPMTAVTAMVPKARANTRLPVATVETRTDPASAVPSDEPRLETLLDTPEISPWSFSGKADCTTLTDEVKIVGFGGSFADHDLGSDEPFPSCTCAGLRHV